MTCQKLFGGKFLGTLFRGATIAALLAMAPLTVKGSPDSPDKNVSLPKEPRVNACVEKVKSVPSSIIYRPDFLLGEGSMCRVNDESPKKIKWDFDMAQN